MADGVEGGHQDEGCSRQEDVRGQTARKICTPQGGPCRQEGCVHAGEGGGSGERQEGDPQGQQPDLKQGQGQQGLRGRRATQSLRVQRGRFVVPAGPAGTAGPTFPAVSAGPATNGDQDSATRNQAEEKEGVVTQEERGQEGGQDSRDELSASSKEQSIGSGGGLEEKPPAHRGGGSPEVSYEPGAREEECETKIDSNGGRELGDGAQLEVSSIEGGTSQTPVVSSTPGKKKSRTRKKKNNKKEELITPQPAHDEPEGPKSVRVEELGQHVTEATLYGLFSKTGVIKSIRVNRDEHTRRCLGSACIEYERHEDAEMALIMCQGGVIEGKQGVIRWPVELGGAVENFHKEKMQVDCLAALPGAADAAHQAAEDCLAGPQTALSLLTSTSGHCGNRVGVKIEGCSRVASGSYSLSSTYLSNSRIDLDDGGVHLSSQSSMGASQTCDKRRLKKANQKAKKESQASQASHSDWLQRITKEVEALPDDHYDGCWDSPEANQLDIDADDSEEGFRKRWAAEQRRDIMDSFLENRILVWCPAYVADLARQDMHEILPRLGKKLVLKSLKAPESRIADEICWVLELNDLGKLAPVPGASKVGCKKERLRVQTVLKSSAGALADDSIKFSDPTEYLWRLQVLRDITLDCWRILPFEGDVLNMFDEILSRLLELEYALPDSN
jgi:hypothetical protein